MPKREEPDNANRLDRVSRDNGTLIISRKSHSYTKKFIKHINTFNYTDYKYPTFDNIAIISAPSG